MTQEEFGIELFQAIKTCSQAQQTLRVIAVEVSRNHDTTELAAEYNRLKEHAKGLVNAPEITDQDAGKLMRQYPWLGH